jgi:hypothetical protein
MAMRWVAATEALPHEASAVHVATALGPQTAEVATALGSRAEGQHQGADTSAAAHHEVHPPRDQREADR